MVEAKLPTHVAVIMDGNGRWAQKCGKTRNIGHIEGAKRVPLVVRHLFSRGVRVVTLYAFSEENFARPNEEVQGIFDRVAEFVEGFSETFGDVRLVFSGELEAVSGRLCAACRQAELTTRSNAPFTLNILLNYGGRSEIIRAARLFSCDSSSDADFRSGLYHPELPDPDLIIRTGGEKRLSGFMPYQSAYSELYFSDVLFPDITTADLDAALEDYLGRSRRFGGIKTP